MQLVGKIPLAHTTVSSIPREQIQLTASNTFLDALTLDLIRERFAPRCWQEQTQAINVVSELKICKDRRKSFMSTQTFESSCSATSCIFWSREWEMRFPQRGCEEFRTKIYRAQASQTLMQGNRKNQIVTEPTFLKYGKIGSCSFGVLIGNLG